MKTEIGHYTVDGKIYTSKFEAILASNLSKKEIKWHFFDDVFSKANWMEEPELALDDFYRIRAQQIRNQYDYIIVFCSGGSDSNNVIRTFLNNKIKVDEVMALAPMSGLKNFDFSASNLDESNTISETKFALLPLLDEIRNADSSIKITINDFFEDIIKYKDEHWTFNAAGNIVTVLTSHFTDVLKFPHIEKLVNQGKRIGLVYGSDKPIIRINPRGHLYFVLSDSGINYLNMPNERANPLIDRVLFYWSPELPELLVKQAHVIKKVISLPQYDFIKKYFEQKPDDQSKHTLADYRRYQEKNNYKQIITKEYIFNRFAPNKIRESAPTLMFEGRSKYERAIVPFIYPTTSDTNLFQCQKVDANAGLFTRDQQWLHQLHGNTRISEMVMSGLKELYKSIPENYLNINGTGMIYHYQAYKFGEIKDFIPTK